MNEHSQAAQSGDRRKSSSTRTGDNAIIVPAYKQSWFRFID
jgi:hypothetical protein